MLRARELLDEVRAALKDVSAVEDNSPFEADWLFMSVTRLGLESLVVEPNMEIPRDLAERLRELARRRAAGEPLQYLLGDVEFLGRRFRVDRRALIPRAETETLVHAALECAPEPGAYSVAELGTGSGVVAVSIALERPEAAVVATDISENALSLARENAELWGVSDRVRFVRGDLTAPLAEPVELLVFNPPYVPSAVVGAIQRDLAYEPRLALDGGADGLDTYRRLAEQWQGAVTPGGWLLVEVGAGQHLAVTRILGGAETRLWDDFRGIVRVVGVRRAH